MTTKFLDNKIWTFKILLSWRFPRKTAFWTIFLSAPQGHPPSKSENFIFIVVSLSLTPAEPRGEKKLFFVQILGGEKLLKFGEKWAVKNF